MKSGLRIRCTEHPSAFFIIYFLTNFIYRVFGKYCPIGRLRNFSGVSTHVAIVAVVMRMRNSCAIHNTMRAALPRPQGGQTSLIMKFEKLIFMLERTKRK